MVARVAAVVQVAALGLLVLAAWRAGTGWGLTAAGFALLLVGFALDPAVAQRRREGG